MKKLSTLALSLATVIALSTAPIASASARGWDHWGHGGGWHHGGGWGPGPIAAVVGATAALVTAPFVIAGALVAPPPAPVYAAPAPVAAYGYPGYGYPGYYQPRRVAVAYGYPPAYAYPAYAPY